MEEHSHCNICGRTVPVGDELCNDKACLEKHQEAQAMKKRSVYLMIALIVAAVVLAKIL